MLTLIDTSAWTHALRRTGDPAVRARVEQLLANGEAAWCDAVRLELWSGVRGPNERLRLQEFEAVLPNLMIEADVWNSACDYASRARSAGLRVPAMDLLIFACAKFHGAALAHVDHHYEMLETLL